MNTNKKVITRFAPSPTGHLHIGGGRTAIFSWLLARHYGGEFRLRIEDTDTERSKQEYTDSILASMTWLGLDWDSELVYQTNRTARYNEVIDIMLANGTAYWCTCTAEEVDAMRKIAEEKGEKPRYNGKCRDLELKAQNNAVVRLKLPASGRIVFDDMVKGKIATDIAELDDMILRRSDGMPTYNLAVVVDDHDMEVTHVMRGDDHVANTPKQILIYQALGWELPIFGHVPMILGPDGQKLSKRNGARAVIEYEHDGILPQALVNYLVRLGWSAGDGEIFTLQELVKLFDGTSLNSSPARIDPTKLDWLNAHYIKETSDIDLAKGISPFLAELGYHLDAKEIMPFMPLYKERVNNLKEFASALTVLLIPALSLTYEEKALKSLTDENKTHLQTLHSLFSDITSFDHDTLDATIHKYVEDNNLKFKQVGPILRCAITGQSGGPSLAALLEVLGKSSSLERIQILLSK